jgi:hypothetical protein
MGAFAIRRGTTRLVIVCGVVAVKVARGEVGRRCNLFEAGIWERNRDHPSRGPRLCPVLWCDPEGHALVMPAVEPLPPGTDMAPVLDVDWWDYRPGGDGWPCEPKPADWGILDGRIVAVDYAAPAI